MCEAEMDWRIWLLLRVLPGQAGFAMPVSLKLQSGGLCAL